GFMRELLGDRSGALNDYSTAIALNPNDYSSFCMRGHLWSDPRKSIVDFSRAIELDGTNDAAYRDRSWFRGKIGDRQGALEDAEKAVTEDGKDAFNFYALGAARRELG